MIPVAYHFDLRGAHFEFIPVNTNYFVPLVVTILDTIVAKTACNNSTSCNAKRIIVVESFQTHCNMVVKDSISKAVLLTEFLSVAKFIVEVRTTDNIDA